MTAPAHRKYVLGDEDAELIRLGFQHRAWSKITSALWERAGMSRGMRVLDVGAGPGFATVDLAYIVGAEGRVTAIDESQRMLDHAQARAEAERLHNVATLRADAQTLDLPEGSADAAFSRWMLCFIPDPEAVVARVSSALRSGGAFAVQDYFNYASLSLAPRGPALERVVQAVKESWTSHGGDLDVAGKIPGWMRKHGLDVREITPHLRVARPGDLLWQWPGTFFGIFVPKLVEQGLLSKREREAFDQEWAERSADPDSFFCTPPVFDIVGVKR